MKNFFLIVALSLLFFSGYSQQLSQVKFSGGAEFSYFSLTTRENVLVRISDDGKIIDFGTEEQSLHNKNYFAQKLQPYLGRIDYYGKESDSAFRDKIKSIGTCNITYYSSKDYPEKIGKIKSASSLFFDYYIKSGDASLTGRIKKIGQDAIAYFSSFDNEAFKGKLKMIGATPIVYYPSFDDTMVKGKLKSIGSFKYTWYTSYDISKGGLKSGAQRQLVNGITYIIQ